MHLKDFEAQVQKATKAAESAVTRLHELQTTIAQADHQISIVKELEKGTAIKNMAIRIEQLENEAALAKVK